jgi:hypothetical protein
VALIGAGTVLLIGTTDVSADIDVEVWTYDRQMT